MAVIKAWQQIPPGNVRLAVDDKGRCFMSRRNPTTPYKWEPWEPYRILDINALPDVLDGCKAITERNNWRKWRPRTDER